MSNYISDSTKTHWMVSNPARTTRTGMDGKPFKCPFCSGNESDTPPEVYRIGDGEANKPGWQIRVFPNLFPITEIHEVVVHSPDHEKNLEDFSLDHVENIIKTYLNRFNFLKPKGKVYIFHNYSLISGASLVHPHSQITVVPDEIPTNTIPVQSVSNIIEQNDNFVAYCPEYSEWSYEVWIKALGQNKFEDMKEPEIKELSDILQRMIKKLKKIHGNSSHYSKKPFGYNYYFSIPQDVTLRQAQGDKKSTGTDKNVMVSPTNHDESTDWYLRIIPRFMERAGFELSTGIMVNSTEAKKASEDLKAS